MSIDKQNVGDSASGSKEDTDRDDSREITRDLLKKAIAAEDNNQSTSMEFKESSSRHGRAYSANADAASAQQQAWPQVAKVADTINDEGVAPSMLRVSAAQRMMYKGTLFSDIFRDNMSRRLARTPNVQDIVSRSSQNQPSPGPTKEEPDGSSRPNEFSEALVRNEQYEYTDQQHQYVAQLQQEAHENQLMQTKLFYAIECKDFAAFKSVFQSLTDIQIHHLIFSCDRLGFSLIHLCAFFGQFEILKYMVAEFRKSSLRILKLRQEYQSQQTQGQMAALQEKITDEQMNQQINEVLRNWVNLHTLSYDGWTALHLACKQSNQMFAYLVEELGADMTLKNQKGINLMHKAAYDDNNYVLTYLRDRAGFSIHDVDNQKNTPLHYACDHKTDYTAVWLIGFGADINAANEEGDTPLHLLIKNSHRLDSSKLVKEMIYKGADRLATNKEGKTPLDILREECEQQERSGDVAISSNLRRELDDILGVQPVYIPCFHIKQPLMKLERSKTTMFFCVAMLSTTYILLFLFVFPFIQLYAFVYPLTILFVLQFIAYTIAANKDPGTVQKSPKISFLKLNQYFRPMYICPTCQVLRPRDSRHCFICNKCIDRHDHHCQWINQCVGIGNHNVFLTYLILIWLYLTYLLFCCFYNITQVIGHPEILVAKEERSLLLPLSDSRVKVAYDTTLAAVILMDMFFLAPLSLLLVIQILNYLHAQTTSARLKMNTLKKVRSQSGLKIQELDGRGYAKEALLNYNDRMKLFIDRDTALRFNKDYTQQIQKDIFESMSGSRLASESVDSRMPGEQDISSESDAEKGWGLRPKNSRIQDSDGNSYRAATPRVLPKEDAHREQQNCTKLMNCMSFCLADRFNQEDMLEEDMGIDTRYLMRTPMLSQRGLYEI